jgi:hypothetical protein
MDAGNAAGTVLGQNGSTAQAVNCGRQHPKTACYRVRQGCHTSVSAGWYTVMPTSLVQCSGLRGPNSHANNGLRCSTCHARVGAVKQARSKTLFESAPPVHPTLPAPGVSAASCAKRLGPVATKYRCALHLGSSKSLGATAASAVAVCWPDQQDGKLGKMCVGSKLGAGGKAVMDNSGVCSGGLALRRPITVNYCERSKSPLLAGSEWRASEI